MANAKTKKIITLVSVSLFIGALITSWSYYFINDTIYSKEKPAGESFCEVQSNKDKSECIPYIEKELSGAPLRMKTVLWSYSGDINSETGIIASGSYSYSYIAIVGNIILYSAFVLFLLILIKAAVKQLVKKK